MTAQRLSDAQISAALRAHMPAHARADVRMRIAAEVSTTRQRQPLPSVFALLSDADPDARRRVMLLAAALLLAVGIVAAAVVGAFLRRDDPVRITSDPAVDAPAFVDEAFAAHRFLPPMTLVARLWDLDGGPVDVQRFIVNGMGHLRHECCDGTIIIIGSEGAGSTNQDGSGDPIWLLGSAGESDALPAFELAMYSGFGTPDCTDGWRYVGPDRVIDRDAHHLACPRQPQGDVELPDLELWLDAELGITLRSATWGVQMDENGQPVSPVGSEMAVESIVFGEPDPALFEPPPGLRAITLAEYTCEYDPASCDATPAPEAPEPITTPEASRPPGDPPDLDAIVAATLQSYVGPPAIGIVIEDRAFLGGVVRRFTDGTSLREERSDVLDGPEPPIITLWIPDGFYETWYLDDGTTEWRRLGDTASFNVSPDWFTLGLQATCEEGWTYLGLDLLLGAETWHIGCENREFWIDRERLLVLRSVTRADALHIGEDAQTVLEIKFNPQSPDLFELPEDAVVVDQRR